MGECEFLQRLGWFVNGWIWFWFVFLGFCCKDCDDFLVYCSTEELELGGEITSLLYSTLNFFLNWREFLFKLERISSIYFNNIHLIPFHLHFTRLLISFNFFPSGFLWHIPKVNVVWYFANSTKLLIFPQYQRSAILLLWCLEQQCGLGARQLPGLCK